MAGATSPPAADLAGVPQDVLDATKLDDGGSPSQHWLTLNFPVYLPVMQYAQNRQLRETVYCVYATRASDKPRQTRVSTTRRHRRKSHCARKKRLLGYANFAEVSLAPKMAKSPAEVIQFLRDLARRARPLRREGRGRAARLRRAELGPS